MLSRSQRFHVDQENPSQSTRPLAGASHKTPARQPVAGPSKAGGLQTGGKGLTATTTTTARSGRVLGAKDGNQRTNGGAGGNGGTALLFPTKTPAAKQKASTSAMMLSPPPAPAMSFRTPSPGLNKYPPMSFSPEAEVELEAEADEPELDLDEDREVEYAGASAADYEEPFDTGLPDFKTAGFGAALRAMPILPCDHEAAMKQDEEERKAFRVELDPHIEREEVIDPLYDPAKPMFPLPKRQALAQKTSNVLNTSRSRPKSALNASTAPTNGRNSSVATSGSLGSSVSSRKTFVSQPATTRPLSSSIRSASAAAPRPVLPPPRPAQSTGNVPSRRLVAKSSTGSSLGRVNEQSATTTSSRPAQSRRVLSSSGSLVGDPEAEKELGIFGIEDLKIDLLEDGMEVEREEFRFDLDA